METQEKSMQDESMETQMESDSMNEMEAMPKAKMSITPQEAISGLIKNHMIVFEEKLNDAKMRYADASLDDENWTGKYERKMECKILEGKMEILNTVQKNFENMFTPKAAMQ